jgi:hypothetical protein
VNYSNEFSVIESSLGHPLEHSIPNAGARSQELEARADSESRLRAYPPFVFCVDLSQDWDSVCTHVSPCGHSQLQTGFGSRSLESVADRQSRFDRFLVPVLASVLPRVLKQYVCHLRGAVFEMRSSKAVTSSNSSSAFESFEFRFPAFDVYYIEQLAYSSLYPMSSFPGKITYEGGGCRSQKGGQVGRENNRFGLDGCIDQPNHGYARGRGPSNTGVL